MKISAFAGKGGVGKSTSSAAYSLSRATREPVLLIDCDAGHSVKRVLGLPADIHRPSNAILETPIDNLSIAVIDKLPFQSISSAQKLKVPRANYMSQFPEHYGLVPFNDMMTEFFGVLTDIHSISYFATLTTLFEQAAKKSIGEVVLDVEPTAGLERLLNSTASIARSFRNLRDLGTLKKKLLGTQWPDIAAFLESHYIKNADSYAAAMEQTAKLVQEANYHLVCIPEESPVRQMEDVGSLVKSYSGSVRQYVINNVRGLPYERKYIDRVVDMAEQVPVALVSHDPVLHSDNIEARRKFLRETGKEFV